jgi:hypothetical protein
MLDTVISSITAGTTVSFGTWAKGPGKILRQCETFSACPVHNNTSDFCKLSWGINVPKYSCENRQQNGQLKANVLEISSVSIIKWCTTWTMIMEMKAITETLVYLSTDTTQWPKNISAHLLPTKASNLTEIIILCISLNIKHYTPSLSEVLNEAINTAYPQLLVISDYP